MGDDHDSTFTLEGLTQSVSPLALRDQHRAVIDLLHDVPPDVLLQSPDFSYWLVLAFLSTAHLAEGDNILCELETQPADDALSQGRLAILRSVRAIFLGNSNQALAYAQEALQILPISALQERFRALATIEVLSVHVGDSSAAQLAFTKLLELRDQLPVDQRWWYQFVVPNRADWLLKSGRIDEAGELLEPQLLLCPSDCRDIILLRLAIISLEKQDLNRANVLISSISESPIESYWSLEETLVRVAYFRAAGDTDAAIALITDLIPQRVEYGSNVEIRRLQLVLADIWIDTGELMRASSWLLLISESLDPWPRSFGHPTSDLVRARLAIANSNWAEAKKRLLRLSEEGIRRQHNGLLIRIYSHLTYVAVKTNNLNAARTYAQKAIAAGQHGAFQASFMVGENDIRPYAYLDSMARAATDRAGEDGIPLLSARELEVLRLLSGDQSLKEVADSLFITYNTVKVHTQSIYRKLGVKRREDAVQIAQLLGFPVLSSDEN